MTSLRDDCWRPTRPAPSRRLREYQTARFTPFSRRRSHPRPERNNSPTPDPSSVAEPEIIPFHYGKEPARPPVWPLAAKNLQKTSFFSRSAASTALLDDFPAEAPSPTAHCPLTM